MKNTYKIVLIFVLSLTIISCSDDDDSPGFTFDSSSGWVEFRTSTTDVTTNMISIPLDVNVPVFPEGINLKYSVQNVSGVNFSDFIGNPSGTVFADPEDISRNTRIEIPLIVDIVENGNVTPTSFDITLTAVDKDGVRLGIDSESILTHRVTINCINSDVLPSDLFVGGYSIADVDATTGPGNGTTNLAGEVGNKVSLTIDPNNPNNRIFNAGILPAFFPGILPVTISFTRTTVGLGAPVETPLSCNMAASFFILNPQTEENNLGWNICDDESIIVTYIEDPEASCGGPFESSFMLTKN